MPAYVIAGTERRGRALGGEVLVCAPDIETALDAEQAGCDFTEAPCGPAELGTRMWCPADPYFMRTTFGIRYQPPTTQPAAPGPVELPPSMPAPTGTPQFEDDEPFSLSTVLAAMGWGGEEPPTAQPVAGGEPTNSFVDAISKGIADAFKGSTEPPVPTVAPAVAPAQPQALEVQQAGIMPPGAFVWVAGGLIVLAVGAGVWALWPRGEE